MYGRPPVDKNKKALTELLDKSYKKCREQQKIIYNLISARTSNLDTNIIADKEIVAVYIQI